MLKAKDRGHRRITMAEAESVCQVSVCSGRWHPYKLTANFCVLFSSLFELDTIKY